MEHLIREKVVLGVSACNFGAPFRYNRKGWDRIKAIGREHADFIWQPVCPEVSAGLGVPRDPIRIVGGNGDDVWAGNARIKNRRGQDVTDSLKESCQNTLKILNSVNASGYVYMEGSPTCGVYRTTLRNKRLGQPPGLFGSLLFQEGFFLIPAIDLDSPLKWWDWRRRLHAYAWVKEQDIQTKQDLYNLWYTVKFLCQELDEPTARSIGSQLASLSKGFTPSYVVDLKKQILQILRKPSTVKRIKEGLWKSYVYYKKATKEEIEEIMSSDMQRNISHITQELIQMERQAFQNGTFFSSAPILYRSEQRVNKMMET